MKISVITATYNSSATIASTIESLLGQTFADWEHIIVDGGSTDNTAEIVARYADRYAGRVSFVSERDRGIYDAMNKGIARAKGDVVGLLNSDDFFTTETVLERIALAFDEAERVEVALDAVYGDVMYVAADDTTRMVRYYSSQGFRRWKMRLGYMPAHPSFYCRRDIYSRFGNFDIRFRVAADFENLLRVIFKGKAKTKYLPLNAVTMRVGGASSSGFASHRRILRDHMRAYRKNSVPSGFILDFFRYPLRLMEILSFHLHIHRNR